jgi:ABC-type methionine transport system permease subunit
LLLSCAEIAGVIGAGGLDKPTARATTTVTNINVTTSNALVKDLLDQRILSLLIQLGDFVASLAPT